MKAWQNKGEKKIVCFPVTEGIVRMMNTREDFYGPVNLGNPGEFTIKELADIILEMTGSSSKIVYCELPSDDPLQRRPNISLAYNTNPR